MGKTESQYLRLSKGLGVADRAGYDLNELESGIVNNIPASMSSLGNLSIGGVTRDYPGLKAGGVAVSIEYSALGRILNNGYDVVNLISHERGQHMPDALGGKMMLGRWKLENRATLHQLQHSTWKNTSREYQKHIKYNQGRFLYESEFKKYFSQE